jgi:hypothetical protein
MALRSFFYNGIVNICIDNAFILRYYDGIDVLLLNIKGNSIGIFTGIVKCFLSFCPKIHFNRF